MYCRKSTESEDRQLLSLDSQEKELTGLAERLGLPVFKILRESKSAKAPGRPIFNEMIKMLETEKADGVICWKVDRLSRNPIDSGTIQWLLQNSKIKHLQTFEKSFYPSDNVLLLCLEQGNANQMLKDLSSNVLRGNRAKLEKGGWPGRARFGYLNDKAEKTLILDPARAKYIPRAFDLYLTGSYSLRDIASKLFSEGLRTKSGKKVMLGQIQRILKNPFYYGLMIRAGKAYPGYHPTLITKETFDQAQEMLSGRTRPRGKKLFFPLRGFMKCEKCGCALTASIHKGHDYYYCTNRREICDEHKSYMRETYLYKIFADLLGNVDFTEKKIELMYRAAKEKSDQEFDYANKALTTLQNELQAIKMKESRLLDTFLAEQIDKDIYDQRVLSIRNEKVSIEKQISDIGVKSPVAMLEPIKKVFLEASRAKNDFLTGDENKKRKVLENLCWNLSFKEKTVAKIKLKSPYDVMFKADKNADFLTLCAMQDSNLRHLQCK